MKTNDMGCEIRFCHRCEKEIKGKSTYHVPPTLDIHLGVDSVKVFHPACYIAFKNTGVAVAKVSA
jgi:hypothetical protein